MGAIKMKQLIAKQGGGGGHTTDTRTPTRARTQKNRHKHAHRASSAHKDKEQSVLSDTCQCLHPSFSLPVREYFGWTHAASNMLLIGIQEIQGKQNYSEVTIFLGE